MSADEIKTDAGLDDRDLDLNGLLPCPFCGSRAEYDDNKSGLYGFDVPGVECKGDGSFGRKCQVRNFAWSKEDAIAMWNKRQNSELSSPL